MVAMNGWKTLTDLTVSKGESPVSKLCDLSAQADLANREHSIDRGILLGAARSCCRRGGPMSGHRRGAGIECVQRSSRSGFQLMEAQGWPNG